MAENWSKKRKYNLLERYKKLLDKNGCYFDIRNGVGLTIRGNGITYIYHLEEFYKKKSNEKLLKMIKKMKRDFNYKNFNQEDPICKMLNSPLMNLIYGRRMKVGALFATVLTALW